MDSLESLSKFHFICSKSLREPCTLNDLQEIFESIVRSLVANKVSWLPYIFPENNALPDELSVECEVEEILSRDSNEKMEILLQETRDILDRYLHINILCLSYLSIQERCLSYGAGVALSVRSSKRYLYLPLV